LSVGNKKILLLMDLLTEKAHKKKLSASFRQYFPWKNTVCNSIGNYLKIFFKKSILQNYKIIKLI
jgi:CRISPR/Cas system-associated protein endoribonuclease Cas2